MKPRMRPVFEGLWMCHGNGVAVFDATAELAFKLWVECVIAAATGYYGAEVVQ